MPSVQALGKALSDANLKGSTFVVAGHTDAIGSEAYNQDLSERRPIRSSATSPRIRHQRHRARHRRLRQDQAEGSETRRSTRSTAAFRSSTWTPRRLEVTAAMLAVLPACGRRNETASFRPADRQADGRFVEAPDINAFHNRGIA